LAVSDEFQIGDVLEWRNRANPDAVLEKRQVTFKGWRNHQALVSFGLTSDGRGDDVIFSVPRDEVSKPVPPQPFYKPEPPTPPLPVPLSERREVLRQCFNAYEQAQQKVVDTEELVLRAQGRVNHARHALREYADLEAHAAAAVIHSIKHVNGNGEMTSQTVADEDSEWQARDRAARNAVAAESALHQLSQDLVDARLVSNERLESVEQAGAYVIAGVIERETLKLAMLEAQAVEVRNVLRAASMLWVNGAAVPVNPEASTILSTWPYDQQDPVGERVQLAERRQAPFSELYARLVSGDTEAELDQVTVQ
jgi:hypothetical protein